MNSFSHHLDFTIDIQTLTHTLLFLHHHSALTPQFNPPRYYAEFQRVKSAYALLAKRNHQLEIEIKRLRKPFRSTVSVSAAITQPQSPVSTTFPESPSYHHSPYHRFRPQKAINATKRFLAKATKRNRTDAKENSVDRDTPSPSSMWPSAFTRLPLNRYLSEPSNWPSSTATPTKKAIFFNYLKPMSMSHVNFTNPPQPLDLSLQLPISARSESTLRESMDALPLSPASSSNGLSNQNVSTDTVP